MEYNKIPRILLVVARPGNPFSELAWLVPTDAVSVDLAGCYLQIFHHKEFTSVMSVAYEPRAFMHDGAYPNLGDDNDRDHAADLGHDRYTDHEGMPVFNAAPTMIDDERDLVGDESPMAQGAVLDLPMVKATTPQDVESDQHIKTVAPPLAPMDQPTPPPSARIKAIPKPDREVSKQADGRFYCSWPGCTDEKQVFARRCEWR